ncbi:MAG: hypothetical protein U9R58_01095 [Chloroflexota bacterium]|nr:hypothetical protein [Chloroflexota bacterium]
MTTRSDLRNLCRRRLGDTAAPYAFSDLQINQWINDAIAEYSIHFPRTLNTTITCSAGDRIYELPSNFRASISVEYPAGEDPPEYLKRRSYLHDGFWDQAGFYDVMMRFDESDSAELWISKNPAASETIAVCYLGDHPSLDDDTDTCTVLDRHLELIVLFVRWTSYQELASTESADPDPTSLSMGTLELNAYRAKREYRTKLADWKAAESDSASAHWRMDGWDRVY